MLNPLTNLVKRIGEALSPQRSALLLIATEKVTALYDNLSGPAEYIRVVSKVVDYGTAPVLAGDRVWVTLPNENVDGYYRIISVECRLIAETQTLETTLELGKEPPLLADYLYSLKNRAASVARYKIGRI